MRCRHGRCRWSWRKQYEYKTGKKRSEKYSESIPVKGRGIDVAAKEAEKAAKKKSKNKTSKKKKK